VEEVVAVEMMEAEVVVVAQLGGCLVVAGPHLYHQPGYSAVVEEVVEAVYCDCLDWAHHHQTCHPLVQWAQHVGRVHVAEYTGNCCYLNDPPLQTDLLQNAQAHFLCI